MQNPASLYLKLQISALPRMNSQTVETSIKSERPVFLQVGQLSTPQALYDCSNALNPATSTPSEVL